MKPFFLSIACLLTALVIHAPLTAQKNILDEDFNTNKNGWVSYIDNWDNVAQRLDTALKIK